jgi:hypothetical protein
MQRCSIERTVVAVLRIGDLERYELDEEGAAYVARVLATVVERENAVEELSRLLALIAALRGELESPRAADTLESIARANARAVAIIAHHILRSGALDETRAFKTNEGRADPLCAPRIDSSSDEETIRLADLLDPASTGRIRHPYDRNRQREQDAHRSTATHPGAAAK